MISINCWSHPGVSYVDMHRKCTMYDNIPYYNISLNDCLSDMFCVLLIIILIIDNHINYANLC